MSKWITIHPNGEENKGRPLLLQDGETPEQAIERCFGKKVEKIKIVRETNKAYLIKKGDKQAWVQKKMAQRRRNLNACWREEPKRG